DSRMARRGFQAPSCGPGAAAASPVTGALPCLTRCRSALIRDPRRQDAGGPIMARLRTSRKAPAGGSLTGKSEGNRVAEDLAPRIGGRSSVSFEEGISEGIATLEVRWMRAGAPDAAVAAWFERFPAAIETREDTYLVGSRREDPSVKIRGGVRFEVKVHDG